MITHVAIRFQGKLYSLPSPNRHHDVIRLIIEQTGAMTVDAREDDQGFLANGVGYCRRKPALRIALQCGQCKLDCLGGSGSYFRRIFGDDDDSHLEAMMYSRADMARAWAEGHQASTGNHFMSENPYDNHLNPLPQRQRLVIADAEGRPDPRPVCVECVRCLSPNETTCPFCRAEQPTCGGRQ